MGGGDGGNGAQVENLRRCDRKSGTAGAGGDLENEDGVAAEVEDVVGDADVVAAEDLFPDFEQAGFGGC